ncbi:hypothetical protein L3X38_035090 [Prunus dulcis]|uniref:Uncharacterized protein n=1 Tax=Prunus dulcis TaxID=3755 RepID=A0AAD4YYC8_PRUDU|nr:hypothetical protein L3X38_035090 [Prunus dulcis]
MAVSVEHADCAFKVLQYKIPKVSIQVFVREHVLIERVRYGTNKSSPSFRLRRDFLVGDLLVLDLWHSDPATSVIPCLADGRGRRR